MLVETKGATSRAHPGHAPGLDRRAHRRPAGGREGAAPPGGGDRPDLLARRAHARSRPTSTTSTTLLDDLSAARLRRSREQRSTIPASGVSLQAHADPRGRLSGPERRRARAELQPASRSGSTSEPATSCSRSAPTTSTRPTAPTPTRRRRARRARAEAAARARAAGSERSRARRTAARKLLAAGGRARADARAPLPRRARRLAAGRLPGGHRRDGARRCGGGVQRATRRSRARALTALAEVGALAGAPTPSSAPSSDRRGARRPTTSDADARFDVTRRPRQIASGVGDLDEASGSPSEALEIARRRAARTSRRRRSTALSRTPIVPAQPRRGRAARSSRRSSSRGERQHRRSGPGAARGLAPPRCASEPDEADRRTGGARSSSRRRERVDARP